MKSNNIRMSLVTLMLLFGANSAYATDLDGDGIENRLDIDDDNDGILDADESPACFYTKAESTNKISISSDILPYSSSYKLSTVIDGKTDAAFYFKNKQNIAGKSLFVWETAAPQLLDSVQFSHTNSRAILYDTSSRATLQAWSGTAWVDLADASNSASIRDVITITKNSGTYKKYRLFGQSGYTYSSGGVVEILVNSSSTASYVASLNPKPTCVEDVDDDGQLNHQDLNSDSDTCSDGVEGGSTLVSNNNFTTFNTGEDANHNGLLDTFENGTSSSINYTLTDFAYNSKVDACFDSDSDGVLDVNDLDDDNDGILDSIECARTELYAKDGYFEKPLVEKVENKSYSQQVGDTTIYYKAIEGTIAPITEQATSSSDQLYASGTSISYTYPWFRSTMEITFSTPLTTRWAITDIDQPTENIDVTIYDVHGNVIPNPEDFMVTDLVSGSDGTFPGYVDINYTDISTNAHVFTPAVNGKLHIEDGPGGVTYGFARQSMIFFDFGGKAISKIIVSNNSTSAAPGFIFSSLKPTNDTDGDGLVDCIDPDSDGDGCLDAKESHPTMTSFAEKPVVDANGLVTAFGVTGNTYTQTLPTLSNGKYAYQEGVTIAVQTNPNDVLATDVGADATFTAKATATREKTSPATTASTNLSYQWEVSTDGGKTYSNIAGATGTTLSGTTVSYTKSSVSYVDNNSLYRVKFSNEAHICSKTSEPATLTVTRPAQPPVAKDDKKTGVTGNPTTLTPLGNDSDPDNNVDNSSVVLTKSTVAGSTISVDGKSATIPNEGTWSVDGSGSVTFTPDAGFTKDPTPIAYKISDKTSLISNEAILTIDYPQTSPVAKDDRKSGIPTESVTIDPFINNGSGVDSDPENDLLKSSLLLTSTTATGATVASDGKSITVPNEGAWSVSSEGDVTFTPNAGFLSDPTPVKYKVFDKTGLVSNEATITVDYADVHTIAGKVSILLAGNNITPLEPVTITLKDATGAVVSTTTTDANGNYEFTNMIAGIYSVVETNPSATISVSDKDGGNLDEIAVDITSANSLDNNFVDKPEVGTLKGTVYKESTSNSIYDGTDQPLPNVDVIVTDAYGKEHKVSTDVDGKYSVLNLPAGPTTVSAVSDDADLPEGAYNTEHPSPTTVTVKLNETSVHNMGYAVPTVLDIDPAEIATCANPTSITWAGSTKGSSTSWSGEAALKAEKKVTTVGGKTVEATFTITDNSSKFNYVDTKGKNGGTNRTDGNGSVFPQPYMSLYLGKQLDNSTTDLFAGEFSTLTVDFNTSVILDNWRIRDIDSGDTRGSETNWAWQDAVQMKGYDANGNEVALSVALSNGTNLEKLNDGFVQTVDAETGDGIDSDDAKGHAIWSSNGLPLTKLVLIHKAGSKIAKQTRAAIALSGFAVCQALEISGTIYNDGNGSKEGVNGTPMGKIEGTIPLYAHLVTVAGDVLDVVEVNATTGTYLFDKNISPDRNYSVQISTTKTEASNPMPAVTLPEKWHNVSEDATLDGSRVVEVFSTSVINVDFGLDKAPENADILASKVLNPGGTTAVPLSADPISDAMLIGLGIKDLEDTVPATMVIETLPTTGKVYYAGTAIKVGQVIENIDYSKVTLDPDNGNVTLFFNFHMVDEANISSPSKTFKKEFYYVEPKAENDTKTNTNPIDPSNPTTVEVIGSDTNGTYPFDPSSVTLIDPLGNKVKTLTVTGEGVWSVEDNGSITFTPEADFYSDPSDVNYTIADTEGNEVKAEVKIDYPDRKAPVAVDDKVTGTLGTPTTLTPVTNDTDPEGDLNASSIYFTSSPVDGATISADGKNATVPNEGTWSVDGSGDVTFTPNAEFKGDPTPIKYKVLDKSGLESNEAKITIDYPQTAPVAKNDKGRGATGTPVTLTPIDDNGEGKDSDPEDDLDPSSLILTSPDATDGGKKLTVPAEGIWTVLLNGDVTFTPNTDFSSDPTPVDYKVFDKTNLPSNVAKISIDYPAESTDDKGTGIPGDPVSIPVFNNDGDIKKSTIKFIDPELKIEVPKLIIPNEGVWSIELDGNITFTPDNNFTGDPTHIKYVSKDKNGNDVPPATVTVDYPQTPKDDNKIGEKGKSVTVPVLENDDMVEKDSVKLLDPEDNSTTTIINVPNEGEWSVDPDGNVTFTPKKDFTGDPTPIKYVSKDKNGNDVPPATVTVYYPKTPTDDSKIGETGKPVTVNVLDNDDVVDPKTVKIIDKDGNQVTELNVPNEGTWKVDPSTGAITFTPNADFKGDPTPIKYVSKDKNGNDVPPATVTVDYPVVIEVTEDNKTGETGKPVTLDVLANDKGEKPLDPTSVMIIDKDGNPVTELVVENEGIWSVDPITGAITFTPEDGFKENPTPITYIVKDEDGKTSEPAKVVVNYPLQLTADVRSNIPLHTPVTVDVLTNDTKEPLNEDTVKIVGTNNAGDSLVVKGEGTWSVVNGKIIFTPEDGFELDPSDIQYTVENMDGVERTAVTVTVNYVPKARPDVKLTDLAEPVTVPVLENDNGDLNVSTVKIVLPENFMSENPNAKLSADGKELIVPEQGTWSVNADGTITYKAEEGRAIVDPTPISYSVQDKSGKLLNTDALVTLNQTVVAGESDTNCSNVCDTYEDNVGVFQGFSSLLMMLFALFFGFMSIRKEKF